MICTKTLSASRTRNKDTYYSLILFLRGSFSDTSPFPCMNRLIKSTTLASQKNFAQNFLHKIAPPSLVLETLRMTRTCF